MYKFFIGGNNLLAAAFAFVPIGDHGHLPAGRPSLRCAGEPLMILSRTARNASWRSSAGWDSLFLYLPLMVVVSTAVVRERSVHVPPDGFTLEWFNRAFDNAGASEALWPLPDRRVLCHLRRAGARQAGLSFAVHRFSFFGRDTVSLMVVLPIALPGIVTALALNSAFDTGELGLGLVTLVLAHSTFCIVVVVQQRGRPAAPPLAQRRGGVEPISAANTFQTFRYVTFPLDPLGARWPAACSRSPCPSTRSS